LPLIEPLATVIGARDFVVVGMVKSKLYHVARQRRKGAAPTVGRMFPIQRQGDAVHLFDGFAPDVFAPGGGGEHIAFTAKNTLPLALLGGNFRAEGDAVVNGAGSHFHFCAGNAPDWLVIFKIKFLPFRIDDVADARCRECAQTGKFWSYQLSEKIGQLKMVAP
jgi:hypothetical protein